MKQRNYLILFLVFFGELLLVLIFLHFGSWMPGKIIALNILVCSIIFLAYMLTLLQPIHLFSDRSQKKFAGLGIRGYSLVAYTIATVGLMVTMNGTPPQSFGTQVLVQAVLLFLLGLGLFLSATAADKAGAVYQEQKSQRASIDEARRIAVLVSEKSSRSSLPPASKDRISRITADLRFISPAGTAEALHLEVLLLGDLQQLDTILSLPITDSEKADAVMLNFESLYRQRKQIYS